MAVLAVAVLAGVAWWQGEKSRAAHANQPPDPPKLSSTARRPNRNERTDDRNGTDVFGAIAQAIRQPAATAGPSVRAALIAAAADDPDLAVEIGRMLIRTDPEIYGAPGGALVEALVARGDFAAAARLATGVPIATGRTLTADAFLAWGGQAPDEALRAVDQIPDARLRRIAFAAVIEGWADRDPAGLSVYARAYFGGEAQAFALRRAATAPSGRPASF